MTRDEIISMALEAGMAVSEHDSRMHYLERFAALVAAAEREACAKLVGGSAQKWWSIHCASNKHMETTRKAHDDFCALQAAIQARSKA